VLGNELVRVISTPGHTPGSSCFLWRDRLLTGDTLLIGGCGRTDFQNGDAGAMYDSINARLFTLPDDTLVYPGHDYRGLTVTSVAEEQRFNPRLGGDVNVSDFAGHMNNLGLPHPKRMDIAVPANLRCGRPAEPHLARGFGTGRGQADHLASVAAQPDRHGDG
jgi:glyoxylase-like metal-dependent hydrolase (beta-lactamase superfamily II)